MTRSRAPLPWGPFQMPVRAARARVPPVAVTVPALVAPAGLAGAVPGHAGPLPAVLLPAVPVPVLRIGLLHAAGLMRNTAVARRPGLSVLAPGQDVTGCNRMLIGIGGREVTHVDVHAQASCAVGNYLLSNSFMSCIPVVGVSFATNRTYLAHVQNPFGYKELFASWDRAARIMIVRKETPPNHVRNVGFLKDFLETLFPGAVEVVDTGFNLSDMGVVVCNSTCLAYRMR